VLTNAACVVDTYPLAVAGPGRRHGAGRRTVRVRAGSNGGGCPLPPEKLRTILAPVDLVWARLDRPTARRLVEAATRSELWG
jgi:hypothetical protein